MVQNHLLWGFTDYANPSALLLHISANLVLNKTKELESAIYLLCQMLWLEFYGTNTPWKDWGMPWLRRDILYIYFCAWGSESNFQGEFLKLFSALCKPLRWWTHSKHITEFPKGSSQPQYLYCPLQHICHFWGLWAHKGVQGLRFCSH